MKVFIVYTCAAIVFATISIANDAASRGSKVKVATSTDSPGITVRY